MIAFFLAFANGNLVAHPKGSATMKHRSVLVTAEMAAYIKHLVIRLNYYQHEAAAIFKINQGRVSEIITGKRFRDVPPADTPPPGAV